MGIPVGDVARTFVKPTSWLGRILGWFKGITISIRGTEISLNEDHSTVAGTTKLDRTPGGPLKR